MSNQRPDLRLCIHIGPLLNLNQFTAHTPGEPQILYAPTFDHRRSAAALCRSVLRTPADLRPRAASSSTHDSRIQQSRASLQRMNSTSHASTAQCQPHGDGPPRDCLLGLKVIHCLIVIFAIGIRASRHIHETTLNTSTSPMVPLQTAVEGLVSYRTVPRDWEYGQYVQFEIDVSLRP